MPNISEDHSSRESAYIPSPSPRNNFFSYLRLGQNEREKSLLQNVGQSTDGLFSPPLHTTNSPADGDHPNPLRTPSNLVTYDERRTRRPKIASINFCESGPTC